MPTGMSTAGFFTSSASVDTQSNPMKEKNTNAAPSKILQGGGGGVTSKAGKGVRGGGGV
jgi:hypothetical protein